jgi:UDP-N-acetylmuramoylalanine--D-glutamate ligase
MAIATGTRIAVFGLGRSGLAIAKAAQSLGAEPVVYDERAEEAISKRDVLDEARALSVPLAFGWDGRFAVRPDLLVVNPAVAKTHPVLKSALDEGIEVVSEVEYAFRIARAPIVAITGTNGKSTTTVMTYLALKACGIDVRLCGNIFGSGYPEQTLTEAALEVGPGGLLVAEISSFQLEWVVDFRPAVAGITNIWPDHLDRYESFAEYAATKQRIFARQGVGDFAVVKANDPTVVAPGARPAGSRHRRPATATPSELPTVLTFGATGEHARVEERDLFVLDARIPLADLPFGEPHNLQNASMAALLAYAGVRVLAERQPESHAAELVRDAEGDSERRRASRRNVYSGRETEAAPAALPPAIVEGLRSFRGLAHRMEPVGERDGIRVINNSMCTNPDAVMKSTMALRDPAHLLIGGVNKDLDFGPLRNYLANARHRAYLFGSDAAGLNAMLGGGHPTFATLDEAFGAASAAARAGEVIMLAPGCASTDQFRDFRHRGDVFRNIAKEWLER